MIKKCKISEFSSQYYSYHIGVSKDKICHIDHHTCHASYAYWASPLRGSDVLVMTADAYGDGISTTLSTINER